MQDVVRRLLREEMKARLERRQAHRQTFVRPVTIHTGLRGESQIKALSKDLSRLGIGIIGDVEWKVGRIGIVEIHLPVGPSVRAHCEVRWCEPIGQGWYAAGWHFLDERS